MKACLFVFLIGLLSLASCAQRIFSESDLRSLLIGSWDASTSFGTTGVDTRIVLESQGKVTFNKDGTTISETDSVMNISVPEGTLPVKYSSVVHGTWSLNDDQTLSMTRTSEEVTARDEVSRNFIEREEMRKLRSESPTNFIFSFKRISPRKIVTLDSHGSRTTLTRTK